MVVKYNSNGTLDLGFGAETVAEIEPLLVTHNQNGQVEGLKYDRLSTVFVNAFKEQQIDALKEIVCQANPSAAVCRKKE